mmetsp:Transcript_14754/g.43297  ORF Transcript_14754/g.43297 Transcript_14754/m.43297 type:complete len:400 (+) Transcript_14754:126-1325(+)
MQPAARATGGHTVYCGRPKGTIAFWRPEWCQAAQNWDGHRVRWCIARWSAAVRGGAWRWTFTCRSRRGHVRACSRAGAQGSGYTSLPHAGFDGAITYRGGASVEAAASSPAPATRTLASHRATASATSTSSRARPVGVGVPHPCSARAKVDGHQSGIPRGRTCERPDGLCRAALCRGRAAHPREWHFRGVRPTRVGVRNATAAAAPGSHRRDAVESGHLPTSACWRGNTPVASSGPTPPRHAAPPATTPGARGLRGKSPVGRRVRACDPDSHVRGAQPGTPLPGAAWRSKARAHGAGRAGAAAKHCVPQPRKLARYARRRGRGRRAAITGPWHRAGAPAAAASGNRHCGARAAVWMTAPERPYRLADFLVVSPLALGSTRITHDSSDGRRHGGATSMTS